MDFTAIARIAGVTLSESYNNALCQWLIVDTTTGRVSPLDPEDAQGEIEGLAPIQGTGRIVSYLGDGILIICL